MSSGGAVVLIAKQVLAAPAASFDFAGIVATYDHLRLVVLGRCSGAVQADEYSLTINADTGAHYDNRFVAQTGTSSVSGTLFSAQNSAFNNGGDLPGANATASLAGHLIIDFPWYAQTLFDKTLQWASGYDDSGKATSDGVSVSMFAKWRSTFAISELTVAPAGGSNFVTGSSAALYGIT